MEKTLSRIRNLRARRKLSLPASSSPSFIRNTYHHNNNHNLLCESDDDLVEWSGKIRSIIPESSSIIKADSDNNSKHIEVVKKSHSERRKAVQWDPKVSKFPGRAQSEKCPRKRRSGSVSVFPIDQHQHSKCEQKCSKYRDSDGDGNQVCDNLSFLRQKQQYPYTRHGSLPHAFRNGQSRNSISKLTWTQRMWSNIWAHISCEESLGLWQPHSYPYTVSLQ